MVIDDLDDDLRLYLGPSRAGALLEVITVVGDRCGSPTALVLQLRARPKRPRAAAPGGFDAARYPDARRRRPLDRSLTIAGGANAAKRTGNRAPPPRNVRLPAAAFRRKRARRSAPSCCGH